MIHANEKGICLGTAFMGFLLREVHIVFYSFHFHCVLCFNSFFFVQLRNWSSINSFSIQHFVTHQIEFLNCVSDLNRNKTQLTHAYAQTQTIYTDILKRLVIKSLILLSNHGNYSVRQKICYYISYIIWFRLCKWRSSFLH